jgi:hypothetical protein
VKGVLGRFIRETIMPNDQQEVIVRHRLILSAALTVIAILLTVLWFSDLGFGFVDDILIKSGVMLITNTIIVTIALFVLNPAIIA